MHASLRVGQTLLISGEEAKPFGRERKEEMRACLCCARQRFGNAGTYNGRCGRKQINPRCERKGRGAGQSYLRKQQGILHVIVTLPWR